MAERARKEALLPENVTAAFGRQEWLARERVGEKHIPMGASSRDVMRKALASI